MFLLFIIYNNKLNYWQKKFSNQTNFHKVNMSPSIKQSIWDLLLADLLSCFPFHHLLPSPSLLCSVICHSYKHPLPSLSGARVQTEAIFSASTEINNTEATSRQSTRVTWQFSRFSQTTHFKKYLLSCCSFLSFFFIT